MASTQTQNTATCILTYDIANPITWVALKSVQTGKELTVDLTQSSSWDELTPTESQLLMVLCQQNNNARLDMTYEDMRVFKALSERYTPSVGQKIEPQPVSVPEKKLTYIEAKKKAVEKTAHNRYVMLVYDIPSDLEFTNPSARLYRHGFRFNLSCWVMPYHQVAAISDLLNEMTATGRITWHVVEYAEAEEAKIRALAQQAIVNETTRIATSMVQTVMSASDQYRTAMAELEDQESGDTSPKTREKKWAYRNSRIKAALKIAGERLDAAVEAAIAFEEGENDTVDQALKGLRHAIASQRASYNAEVEAKFQI